MRKNETPRRYTSLLYIILIFALIYGCASVQQPMGGPKDTTPPKVLKMTPKNQNVNFNTQKIVIEFDEYFNITNEFKEVSISPELEKLPTLKKKQKRLEITFEDTLAKNTTYTINFGNAISDVTERNVVKNFTYVFSTGPMLDSLSISGNVKSAFTSLPELDAMVFLLPTSADTTFAKKKPSIYTRTDSSGNFKLMNLRPDTYRIYALKEQNGDKLYQQGIEQIGFIKDSIVLKQNVDSIQLNVFKEVPGLFRVLDRKIQPDGTLLLTFNRSLTRPKVTIKDPADLDTEKLFKFNPAQDSVRIWLNKLEFDSVKVAVNESDTLLQTINITRAKKDTYTRLLIPSDNLEAGLLNPLSTLKLTFPLPVTTADITKITLMEDTTAQTNFTIEKDTADFLSYYIKYPWKQKIKYELRFAENAFTGIFNAKNKYFSKRFELVPTTNYSTLTFKLNVADKGKPYVFELINDVKVLVKRFTFKSDTTIKLTNLRTGKYFVRTIYDANNNGVWDSGNLSKKIQPEKIIYDPKAFISRGSFDVQETIEILK